MPRLSFGSAPDDDDTLEIQGVVYHRQPMGMAAFRKAFAKYATEGESPTLTVDRVDAAIEIVVANVVPEERDQLRTQIEEQVSPALLVEISQVLVTGMTDLDPTRARSSSDGSSPTGPASTDGVRPEVSTPST